MTKERTLEQIRVMAASANGETIQVKPRNCDTWSDDYMPYWDWYRHDYRVKPEPPKPRTIWVSFCHDGSPGLVTESEEIAKRWKSSCTNCIAKFTEVLDGQC